jgi:hypothetical protein
VGYTVIDLQTGDATQLVAFTKGKTFNSYDFLFNYTFVDGSAGKNFSVYSDFFIGAPADNTVYSQAAQIKGQNFQIDIGDGSQYWLLPKTFSYVGRYIIRSTGTTDNLEEDSGTLAIDLKTTQAHNKAGFTTLQSLDALRSALIALGYVEQ